jgi:hypothetical protein
MKRLSLDELKKQKTEQVKNNLEAVNGGKLDLCHILSEINEAFKFRAGVTFGLF